MGSLDIENDPAIHHFSVSHLSTLNLNHMQAVGVIFLIVGFILLIGNVTSWWPSFPYAGFITMSIGGLVMRVADEY